MTRLAGERRAHTLEAWAVEGTHGSYIFIEGALWTPGRITRADLREGKQGIALRRQKVPQRDNNNNMPYF